MAYCRQILSVKRLRRFKSRLKFMTAVVRLALARPYTFVVMAILIMVFGALSAFRTPTDIFPNIGIPVISAVSLRRSRSQGSLAAHTGLVQPIPEGLNGGHRDSAFPKSTPFRTKPRIQVARATSAH